MRCGTVGRRAGVSVSFALWLAVGGVLLLFMALSGTLLARMPVSTSMLYLLAGVAAGPLGLAMAGPVLLTHATLLEHVTEVIVLLSLFTSGMKMSLGLRDKRWFPPLRLALGSMLATVVMITAAGVALLGLPLGAAVLLASSAVEHAARDRAATAANLENDMNPPTSTCEGAQG